MQNTTSNQFAMRLPTGMVSRLAGTDWGRQLLGFRDGNDHLFIAVRDKYLSVYVEGRAVFKRIEEKGDKLVAVFDQRYLLGKDSPSGDLHFDGERILRNSGGEVKLAPDTVSPLTFSTWVSRVKNYDLADSEDQSGQAREKGCLAPHALSPSVVNLEMALPGFPSQKDGRAILIAPRIDMVHLEPTQTGAELVFTEAKLFSNKGLRSSSSVNPTVEQILKYRDYLEKHSDAVRAAYAEACKHLVEIRKHQGVEVHPLLSLVAGNFSRLTLRTLPRLLIFKTENDARKSERVWQVHERAITGNGIEIEYA
jgi:hypothetical protein